MDYGFAITDAGRYLIARLLTGETLSITKVMVGSGRVPDGVRLASVEDLYETVAQATTDEPRCEGGIAHLTVEYNNAMGGGLETGFWLREIGVFALDPVAGEILMAYATLGDYGQYVAPYNSARGVDVRRFPLSFAIGEDRGIELSFSSGLWMTAADVRSYYEQSLVPDIEGRITGAIAAHNADPAAHGGFGRLVNTTVIPRILLAEEMEELAVVTDGHVGYANASQMTFATLDGVSMTTGNHNAALGRVEF